MDHQAPPESVALGALPWLHALMAGDGLAKVIRFSLYVIGLRLALPRLAYMLGVTIRRIHAWRFPDGTPSAIRYLHASFTRPVLLLQGMAHAPFILAGSRALAFFFDGSCGEDAPWEFYTYHSAYCVGLAIQTLSACGVVWDDIFQPLRDIANGAPGSIRYIHLDHLLGFLARADALFESGDTLDPEVLAVLREMRRHRRRVQRQPNQYIRLPTGVLVMVLHDALSAPADVVLPAHTITGRTIFGATEQRVRLIFKPDTTPMQHVLAFSASSAQCCMTAFGAAHLHYKITANHQVIFWPENIQHLPDANATAPEYAGRAWKVKMPKAVLSSKVTDRRLCDSEDGSFLPFYIRTGLPPALSSARRQAVKNIKWEFSDGESRFAATETKPLRDILGDSRRARRLDGEPPAGLRWALDLAIAHSVVFHADEVYSLPSELSGL